MGETWEADGDDVGDCPDNYEILWGREFRCDGGRARYLNRELDPDDLMEGDLVSLSDVWTDYDGDVTYGDYAVAEGPTITEQRSYEPGVATRDPVGPSSGLKYTHADPLGTTRALTDYAGAQAASYVYTAFGERIDAGSYLRHGYAGSSGYQAHSFPSGTPIPFLHMGARYYDPATGRFLQRDPIGIAGGWNVYAYVEQRPTIAVDPNGTQFPGPMPRPWPPPQSKLCCRPDIDALDRWSLVHCGSGYAIGRATRNLPFTYQVGVIWEDIEPPIWPGWHESEPNQRADEICVLIGGIYGCFD